MADEDLYLAWVRADEQCRKMQKEWIEQKAKRIRWAMRFHIIMAALIVIIGFGGAGLCLADKECREGIQHGSR